METHKPHAYGADCGEPFPISLMKAVTLQSAGTDSAVNLWLATSIGNNDSTPDRSYALPSCLASYNC